MLFIETPIFTKAIEDLMSDEDYVALQEALILNPELGDLIQGSSGLRKIRWGLEGRGKRGGLRIIYYWKVRDDQILLLVVYRKNVKDNLTKEQIKKLKMLIEEELKHG
jgi:mRNA-degrading endonuclease RelE of RelBE toxin-antitoxin system